MDVGRELRGELVEDVRGVSASGQQNYRPAGATPIEHFEPNVFFNVDKPNRVRRRIPPRAGRLRIRDQ